MSKELESIQEQVPEGRNYDSPPLHLWHPELSGDIDIKITADGSWFHEGEKISREAIVRLFASILRKEEDGEYYLVTPAEKWRIQVEVHPLVVIDVCWGQGSEEGILQATLNTGKVINIDDQHPLFLEAAMENVAAITLPHGLAALFSRNAWYRLVDMAEHRQDRVVVVSGGQSYILG
jgi:hypothetical protein